jgi:hypothetical protein
MDANECERQDGSGTEGLSEMDLLIPKPLDLETQERLLVRKLDRRILPILCFLYLFTCECNCSFL